MAKSKYSPALFEVINRQKNTGTLGVPKWWKGGTEPQSDQAEPGSEPGMAAGEEPGNPASPGPVSDSPMATQAVPSPAEKPARTGWPAPENRYSPPGPSEQSGPAPIGRLPALSVDTGRLQLVLSPTHAAVACGALLIVVLAAFLMGRTLGHSAPAGSSDSSLTGLNLKTPDPSVLQVDRAGAPAAPARAAAGSAVVQAGKSASATPPPGRAEELKVGFHYVLFDTFTPDALEAAQSARDWLASAHNIRSVVCERRGKYWLIGLEGFNYSATGEKERCQKYVEQIKSLGPELGKHLRKAELPVYLMKDPMVFQIGDK